MRMLLRHAALHQWLATAVEPVRNEHGVIGPVFAVSPSLPCAKKVTDIRSSISAFYRKQNHELYGCAPLLMISVLSPWATPG